MDDKNNEQESEIVVKKEDLGEEWYRIDEVEKMLEDIKRRYLKEPTWVMNTSLALLGFYLALLIQLKLANYDVGNFGAMLPLITLALAIIIGFYIKYHFHYDTMIRDGLNAYKELFDFIKILDKKFIEKGAEPEFAKEHKDLLSKFNKIIDHIDSKIREIPHNLISIQSSLFTASLLLVAYYLIRFLFK
jgi:hypothetical protein